jgi:hypothetical protein
MFVTVTEIWDYSHTDDQRILIHNQVDKMQAEGKFILSLVNNGRSVYNAAGSPTKTFTSIEAANEYIAFYQTWKPPVEMIVKSFDTQEDYLVYIKLVADSTYTPDPGPVH